MGKGGQGRGVGKGGNVAQVKTPPLVHVHSELISFQSGRNGAAFACAASHNRPRSYLTDLSHQQAQLVLELK